MNKLFTLEELKEIYSVEEFNNRVLVLETLDKIEYTSEEFMEEFKDLNNYFVWELIIIAVAMDKLMLARRIKEIEETIANQRINDLITAINNGTNIEDYLNIISFDKKLSIYHEMTRKKENGLYIAEERKYINIIYNSLLKEAEKEKMKEIENFNFIKLLTFN